MAFTPAESTPTITRLASEAMATNRQWTCYVSAPATGLPADVRQTLKTFRINTVQLETTPPASTILEAALTAIRQVDFFLLAVTENGPTSMQMVELGLALAIEKRVLALVAPQVELPLDLSEIAVSRSLGADRSQLRFAISGFLELFDSMPVGSTPSRRRQSPSESKSRGVDSLDATSYRVVELFEQSGALVNAASSYERDAADLVVWLPEVIPALGDRLLVEIKSGLLTRHAFSRAREQLIAQLMQSRIRTGLIVYSAMQGQAFKPSGNDHFVLTASLDQLVDEVGATGLIPWLVQQRNRLVHQY